MITLLIVVILETWLAILPDVPADFATAITVLILVMLTPAAWWDVAGSYFRVLGYALALAWFLGSIPRYLAKLDGFYVEASPEIALALAAAALIIAPAALLLAPLIDVGPDAWAYGRRKWSGER